MGGYIGRCLIGEAGTISDGGEFKRFRGRVGVGLPILLPAGTNQRTFARATLHHTEIPTLIYSHHE